MTTQPLDRSASALSGRLRQMLIPAARVPTHRIDHSEPDKEGAAKGSQHVSISQIYLQVPKEELHLWDHLFVVMMEVGSGNVSSRGFNSLSILGPAALRSHASIIPSGILINEIPGADIAVDVTVCMFGLYRVKRCESLARVVESMENFGAATRYANDANGAIALAESVVDRLELIAKSPDAALLLGGAHRLSAEPDPHYALIGATNHVLPIGQRYFVKEGRLCVGPSAPGADPWLEKEFLLVRIGPALRESAASRIQRLRRQHALIEDGSTLDDTKGNVETYEERTSRLTRSGDFYPVVTPIAVEAGPDLLKAHDMFESGGVYESAIMEMRERIKQETGLAIPSIRVFRQYEMPPWSYLIMINELPIEMGTVESKGIFVPEADPARDRMRAITPIIGRRSVSWPPTGKWLEASALDPAVASHASPWGPLQYLVAHLDRILRRNLAQFLLLDEVHLLLEQWSAHDLTAPQAEFVQRLRGDYIALSAATGALRSLLDEGVPLTTPSLLLDGLRAAEGANPIDAVEIMRRSLGGLLPGNDPRWHHFRLSTGLEAMLRDKLFETDGAKSLTIAPEDLSEMQSAIRSELGHSFGTNAIVVNHNELRPYMLRLLSEEHPSVPVLAYSELTPLLQARFPDFLVISLD